MLLQFRLEGEEIEMVEQFTYLGSVPVMWRS